MKELTVRQVSLLTFFLVVVNKLLIFPSLVSSYASRDAYIAVAFSMLIEGFYFLIILKVINFNKNLTFFKLLENGIGRILARSIFVLYAVYFFIKTFVLINESTLFFNNSFYGEFSPIIFLLPMLLLLAYMATLKLKTLARAYEILRVFILVGVLFALYVSLSNADFINTLPILENGLGGVLEGIFKTTFWYGDYLILFLFLGKIKVEKGLNKKLIKTWLLGTVFVVLFVFAFYNIFGETSLFFNNAISDVLNAGSASFLTKINWLIILLFASGLVYCMGLYVYAVYNFISYNIKAIKSYYIVLPIIILLVILLFFNNFNFDRLVSVLTNGFIYFAIIMQYIIPLAIPISLKRIGVKRKVN